MAKNFNTNQNRHIYVVSAFGDVNEKSEVKTIGLKNTSAADALNPELYFIYKGPDTVIKSELIPVKNITYVKAVKKEDLRKPFKSCKLSLDESVNEGNPVIGQDYILRIAFKQFYGMGEEDQYFKDASVHVISGMDKASFYKKMVDSLTLAFGREIGAHAYTKADGSVEGSNPYLSFKAEEDGVVITEKEQPWSLGIESREPVYFDVVPTTIYVDGIDSVWGKVVSLTPAVKDVTVDGDNPTGMGDGKDIADLEYFCMGERGDQYRLIGFPNYVPTTYLVDPSKEYNVLELHFAYTDSGENDYRSEKDITIVSEETQPINDIIAAINKAANINVEDLSSTESTEG